MSQINLNAYYFELEAFKIYENKFKLLGDNSQSAISLYNIALKHKKKDENFFATETSEESNEDGLLSAFMPERWISKNYKKTQAIIQNKISYIPNTIAEHEMLAQVAFNLKDWSKSFYHINRCIILAPKTPRFYEFKASTHFQTGDFSSSIKNLRACSLLYIQEEKDFPSIEKKTSLMRRLSFCYIAKGVVQLESKQLSKALRSFHQSRLIFDNLDAESRGSSPIFKSSGICAQFQITTGWHNVLGFILNCFLTMGKIIDAQVLCDSAIESYTSMLENCTHSEIPDENTFHEHERRLVDLLILRARIHLENGINEAPSAYKSVLKAKEIDPLNIQIEKIIAELNKKSYFYEQRGNISCKNDAMNQFSKAILYNPNRINLYILRAASSRLINRFSEAIDDLFFALKLLENFPDNELKIIARYQMVLTLNDNGLEFHNRSLYKDAIEIFTNVITFDPDQPQYFINRGDSYYQNKDYNSAMLDYEQAVCILNALKRRSELPEEKTWILKNVETRLCLSYCALCRDYQRNGLYGDALESIDAAILLRPGCWQFWAERTKLNYQYQQFKTAREDLVKAVYFIKRQNSSENWECEIESYLSPIFTSLFKNKWPREIVNLRDFPVQKRRKRFADKKEVFAFSSSNLDMNVSISNQIKFYRSLKVKKIPRLNKMD